MSSTFSRLVDKGLITDYPKFLKDNIHYEVLTGSIAYNVSQDISDIDIYGITIPPKNVLFPHLQGKILGFDDYSPEFNQYQQHRIGDKSARSGKGQVYDISIYSIVKYFKLAMDNNPNMVDTLFVPRNCILHITSVGEHIRNHRGLFLHKGSWHKFKGYAYSQLNKLDIKNPEQGSKRAALVEKYGYDVKFAYHVVRLLDEVEQILTTHDLDLTRAAEQLKSIRRGEWSKEDIVNYFKHKEPQLEKIYQESKLPYKPDVDRIRGVLLECLEMHYGSLSKAVNSESRLVQVLRGIKGEIDRLNL